jgi:hypothetical protein
MGRMVRKQMYIDAELDKALTARADQLGVGQAQIVREALGQYLAAKQGEMRDASIDRLRELWAESDAHGYGGGDWRSLTREELHERPGDARRERAHLRGRQRGSSEGGAGA